VASAMVACAKLGLQARYIGTIGDDLRGEIQRDSLDGTRVDTSRVIVRQGCPNQTAYILIDHRSGERTVLWHRAECLRLRAEEIRKEDICSARMLHLDGCDTEAAAVAAGFARSAGIPVSIDVDTVYPGFDAVLRNTDFLVASSVWPTKWTGDLDAYAALARLQKEYRLRVTAMTLGDCGSLALVGRRFYYSAAFQVHCADTTGAGDVYHGAFCYSMLQGMSVPDALEFSNAAAAINCTAIGARGHIPTLEEVRDLLARGQSGEVARHIDPEAQERCRS
jgi:sulfofructose kinase